MPDPTAENGRGLALAQAVLEQLSYRCDVPNNGFRVDYACAANESAQLESACEFDHTPKLLGETDHSALIVSLAHTIGT